MVTFIDRRHGHSAATVAIARELAGWCWSLPSSTRDPALLSCFAPPGGSAWSDPRHLYEQPSARPRSFLYTRTPLQRTTTALR